MAATVAPVPTPARLGTLPVRVVGRVERNESAQGSRFQRQWPGTYFETAFKGREAYFLVGPGDATLQVTVDGADAARLVKPTAGYYRVEGLSSGNHRVRVQVSSESQAAPTGFGGFFAPKGTRPSSLRPASRQIEFIGDSHTVGYGNLSPSRTCTEQEVWATTDTSRGIPAIVAKRYGADYQVNAISGRGIVRNYNGFAADTLPQAYPYILFDKARRDDGAGWKPQVIVIALGTNDFTTPLHAGERWADRAALHADYEATYLRFVRDLRARNPSAFLILWATDMANGEIASEEAKVASNLRAAGDRKVAFVSVPGLSFTACHAHPSVADDQTVSAAIERAIDGDRVWRRR